MPAPQVQKVLCTGPAHAETSRWLGSGRPAHAIRGRCTPARDRATLTHAAAACVTSCCGVRTQAQSNINKLPTHLIHSPGLPCVSSSLARVRALCGNLLSGSPQLSSRRSASEPKPTVLQHSDSTYGPSYIVYFQELSAAQLLQSGVAFLAFLVPLSLGQDGSDYEAEAIGRTPSGVISKESEEHGFYGFMQGTPAAAPSDGPRGAVSPAMMPALSPADPADSPGASSRPYRHLFYLLTWKCPGILEEPVEHIHIRKRAVSTVCTCEGRAMEWPVLVSVIELYWVCSGVISCRVEADAWMHGGRGRQM